MVVIVRAFPDAGRSQHINAEYGHDGISQLRFVQDGVVLVIVVDHKHAYQ